MIFGVATLLIKIFGFDFEKAQKWARWVILLVLILVIGIPTLLIFRACNKPAKIDIKNIEKINKANEVERKAELQKTIEENAGVVKTVDGRNAIAEVNEVEKQAQINAKIAEVDAKIAEAKQQGHDVTSDELHCLLSGEC